MRGTLAHLWAALGSLGWVTCRPDGSPACVLDPGHGPLARVTTVNKPTWRFTNFRGDPLDCYQPNVPLLGKRPGLLSIWRLWTASRIKYGDYPNNGKMCSETGRGRVPRLRRQGPIAVQVRGPARTRLPTVPSSTFTFRTWSWLSKAGIASRCLCLRCSCLLGAAGGLLRYRETEFPSCVTHREAELRRREVFKWTATEPLGIVTFR